MNGPTEEKHRHVQLVKGRAKQAQVYPPKFCAGVCEGIAAQKKKEILGVQSRPLMTIEEMHRAAGSVAKGECPSRSLHEDECEGLIAIDGVTGQELDPRMMKQARRDEIEYFRKMGVYEKVDISEAWKETGKAPIAVRWVDINKGDSMNPCYRSSSQRIQHRSLPGAVRSNTTE